MSGMRFKALIFSSALPALAGCGGDKLEIQVSSENGHVYGSDPYTVWVEGGNTDTVTISAQYITSKAYTHNNLSIESDLSFSGSETAMTRESFYSLDTREDMNAAEVLKVTANGIIESKDYSKSASVTIRPALKYAKTYRDNEPHREQNIAYALPDGRSEAPLKPAIIFIHGGGWSALDFTAFKDEMLDAAENDYAAFSVNYRLVGDGDKSTHTWPAPLDDVRCAIQWIFDNSSDLRVDTDNVGLVGYSAGAHLALLAGMTRANETNTANYQSNTDSICRSSNINYQIKAVSAISAPTSLPYVIAVKGPERDARDKVTALMDMTTDDVKFIDNADHTGDDWIERLRSENASNEARLGILNELLAASPLTYVNNSDIPVLLQHGTSDDLIFVRNSKDFACQSGNTTLKLFEGISHEWGSFNGNTKQTRRQNNYLFFGRHLKGENTEIESDIVDCS
ncbi:MAG: alpha/beta hydrolase [Ketobacteraceae bacterium]|nr:alpha/beta hydrolase [Ketobacteraceae bacterium]